MSSTVHQPPYKEMKDLLSALYSVEKTKAISSQKTSTAKYLLSAVCSIGKGQGIPAWTTALTEFKPFKRLPLEIRTQIVSGYAIRLASY